MSRLYFILWNIRILNPFCWTNGDGNLCQQICCVCFFCHFAATLKFQDIMSYQKTNKFCLFTDLVYIKKIKYTLYKWFVIYSCDLPPFSPISELPSCIIIIVILIWGLICLHKHDCTNLRAINFHMKFFLKNIHFGLIIHKNLIFILLSIYHEYYIFAS